MASCCTATLSHTKQPQTLHKYNANKPGVKLTNGWPSLFCSRSCPSGSILLLFNSLSCYGNYIFNPLNFSVECNCGHTFDIPSLSVHSSTVLALQQSSQNVFWILINVRYLEIPRAVFPWQGWVSVLCGHWAMRSVHSCLQLCSWSLQSTCTLDKV